MFIYVRVYIRQVKRSNHHRVNTLKQVTQIQARDNGWTSGHTRAKVIQSHSLHFRPVKRPLSDGEEVKKSGLHLQGNIVCNTFKKFHFNQYMNKNIEILYQ